jgi:hypothetical protein
MDKPSRREHELAIAAAIVVGKQQFDEQIAEDKSRGNNIVDPSEGLGIVENAYDHALEMFIGRYPD